MPRFSIIVPTLDRPALLPHAVRAALAMDFEDFELIVSDNHSAIPATELLAHEKDSRLRILRTDRRLCAADHWEFIWPHVSGEYVIFVCDDDVLHPHILSTADRLLRQHDLDMMSWRVALYYHPDWHVEYGTLPNRGNVIGLDVGTTGELYAVNADAILRWFAGTLSIVAGFPCTTAALYRKSLADEIRQRAGRLFWPPGPDLSVSYTLLGYARPGGYGFLDGFGAIAGRSQHSNIATMYTRGKGSRRLKEYLAEHGAEDPFPHHELKVLTSRNACAAVVSQARALMPDRFLEINYDRGVLAQKLMEDMYVLRTVPWVEDPDFLSTVDAFLKTLSPEQAIRAMAVRTIGRQHERASNEAPPQNKSRNDSPFWVQGGTVYVDLTPFGVQDIAGAAQLFPQLLTAANIHSPDFANSMHDQGMFGNVLEVVSDWLPKTHASVAPEIASSATERKSTMLKSHLSVEG
jgi:hypothetical protein